MTVDVTSFQIKNDACAHRAGLLFENTWMHVILVVSGFRYGSCNRNTGVGNFFAATSTCGIGNNALIELWSYSYQLAEARNSRTSDDSTHIADDVVNDDVPVDTALRSETAFERHRKSTSSAISSLVLPCVASPITSRQRPQQQRRRTFGVATSSDVEMATSPAIVPAQTDNTPREASESLWNDDVKDDDSDTSLLSIDAGEDIEQTQPGVTNSATWISSDHRATTSTSPSAPSHLPSDLLPNTSAPTEDVAVANSPNSVSAPNTDDEHDSLNDHVDAPTLPLVSHRVPTITTTPGSGSKPEPSTSQNSSTHANGSEVDHSRKDSEPTEETAEEPDMEDVLTSTDILFELVTDKATVTVKDIMQSLQAEYSNVTFTKAMKATIRFRLVELINAAAQSEDADKDEDDDDDIADKSTNVASDVGDSDQSDTDESEADVDTDPEPSDDEDFTATSKKISRPTKKTNKSKPAKSKKARQLRPKKPSAASTKLSLRVHAEQRRKRRLEELRVRNEELLLHQNAIDRERAEQIAAKFATNTDELRQERFEQRINLLQKLNHKRINAFCTGTTATSANTGIATAVDSTGIGDASNAVVGVNPEDAIVEHQMVQPLSGHHTMVQVEDNHGESDDCDSDDDEEEDELEIVGRPPSVKSTNVSSTHTIKATAPPATGALALLDMADANQLTKRRVSKKGMLSPGRHMDQRALLREKLKERQRSLGNQWLARELGYKTEEEHLEVCLAEEKVKRERIYMKEQERIKANERAAERMMHAIDDEEHEEQAEGDTNPMDGTGDEQSEDENFDDEEMAMARELESDQIHDEADTEFDNDHSEVDTNSLAVTSNHPELEIEKNHIEKTVDDVEAAVHDTSCADDDNETAVMQDDTFFPENTPVESNSAQQLHLNQTSVLVETGQVLDGETSKNVNDHSVSNGHAELITETETSTIESNDVASKPKGPRNQAWKAILQQDAEKAKKKKRSQLVEEEADEEEEEEVAGLEDFGFVVHKKNSGEDEDDADLGEFDDDDLEHVVDDISDDEGDELAGEKARKAMEAKEEKDRHKEMLRRMRDGYDGRRGGIAGGTGGARGFHRFDQLVAADNREDAKLLGLLNDDEIDSDNEDEGIEKGADNEDEDEHVLLDKMLKARFLHRSTVEEENFSDDGGDEDNNMIDEGDGTTDKVDEEEKEQERLAKRFAKRARMQRLIEVHGHEAEFSESKLIDEDATLKLELQRMKNGLIRKQSDSTSNSWQVASSWNMNNISQQSKKQKTSSNVTFATSLLSKGGSLAIALQANRKSNKARTSFVSKAGNGGTTSSTASKSSSSLQKCIAFNHVVFHSSNSNTASRSQSMKGVSSNSTSASGNRSNNKLSNVTNNRFVGMTPAPTGAKVSSNQDSLFSKLVLSGNQRKRKL